MATPNATYYLNSNYTIYIQLLIQLVFVCKRSSGMHRKFLRTAGQIGGRHMYLADHGADIGDHARH